MLPIPFLGDGWMMGHALTLLAALGPAVVAWWTDRRLLDKGDDPALPELLASRRRTNVRGMAIGFAIVIVLGGGDAAWGIPLLAAALIAAAYPLRTKLLGETWGFGSYLWHTMLSVAGGFGFWILLSYAPGIVSAVMRMVGPERWQIAAMLAALLAIVLFAFEEWYPRIWLWTHAATPLADPVLTPRFDEIVRRAGTISPRVYRVGPQGSRFVNAVALPSVKRPAVAMGTALLELLEPDETTAIFAHEIAHFDHLTPKRIARSQLINRVLIVLGVALPFITAFVANGELRWLSWVWPLAVLAALVRRAAKSQQHETESDLRAAALCGDPEALVRGLVKLHLSARIPRRYAVEVERASTHPSLVRRIQAIRGGVPAVEQLGGAAVVQSPRAGSWVVLDADRAYWLDGVPEGASGELAALREAASSYRAVSYADLVELRVAAAGDVRTITARARGGETWAVPIASHDVARVQRTLDIVDLKLGKAAPAPSGTVTKIVALAALVATLLAGQVGVVLIPIAIAMWRPTAASFAALGAMSIVRAALGLVEGSRWFDENTVKLGLVAMAATGMGAIYLARRMARGADERRNVRFVAMTLGFVAIIIAAAIVRVSTQTSVAMLAGVPLLAALGTLIIGIAAVAFLVPAKWGRPAALAGIVVGSAAATVGVDRKSLSLRNALTETTASATPVSQVDLGGVANGLRVAPNGRSFLAVRSLMGRRPTTRQFTTLLLGRFGGSVREVSGVAAEFVDDDRVLVLDALEQGMELRIETVDSSSAPVWTDTLPDADFIDSQLIVDRDSSAWTIVGEDANNDRTALYAGRIGEKGSMRRATIPDTIAMIGEPIVFGQASTVIVPTYTSRLRGGGVTSLWALPIIGMDALRSDLWRVRGDSLARVSSLRGVPQCGAPANGVAACASRHNRGTSLYLVDADGKAVEVAQLALQDVGVIGLGPGPRLAGMRFDRTLQVIDLATRRLTKVPLPAGSDYPGEVRAGPGFVVTLSYDDNRKSTVRLFQLR